MPEYGEPDGGKNIIVGYVDDTKPIYADWTEVNIGDTIHYQIRVNAMNFIREDSVENDESGNPKKPANNDEFVVKQVKEYVIADYQKDGFLFGDNDHITVSILDSNGNTVGSAMDYTSWAKYFFIDQLPTKTVDDGNGGSATVSVEPSEDILGNGGGIVIPWAKQTTNKTEADAHKIVTSFVRDSGEKDNEETQDVDESKQTVYWYSIYDSDMTIVVDYTMTLTDLAKIDDPGNINYSQYGMNFTDEEDYNPPTHDNPPENPPEKPDETRDVDTATVYTYALAIQKVDNDGNKLAGATFAVKGLKDLKKISDGYYKVEKYDPTDDTLTELIADKDGLLVVEGFMSSAELTVEEVKAPDGYNLLKAPETMHAIKVGKEVTTTAKTTYYSDEARTTVTGKEEGSTSTMTYYDSDGTTVKAKAVTEMKKITAVDGKVTYENETTYYGNSSASISKTDFDTIVGTINKTGSTAEVVSANLTLNAIEVVNNKGNVLPSTGGIGTTLFYLIGAILVIGAGVVLITRRRMSAHEE